MPKVVPQSQSDLTQSPPRLRTNFAWTLAGNVYFAATQWAILSAIAKWGSVTLVGEFALALAVTSPIVLFLQMHLRNLQATDTSGQFSFSDYLTARLATTGAALATIACIGLFGGYSGGAAATIVAVGVLKSVDSISDIFHGYLHRHEKMEYIARGLALRGTASLLGFSSVLWFLRELPVAILASACISLLTVAVFDIPPVRRHLLILGATARPGWNPAQLRRILRLAAPLGFVALMVSLTPNIPRFFVERKLGLAALGVYAGMSYVMVAAQTVIMALARSASPRLARHYSTNNIAGFNRLLSQLILLGVAGTCCALLVVGVWGDQILTALYNPAFAGRSAVFFWIVVASGLSYVAAFLWQGITAARLIDIQIPLFAAVCLTAVVLSILLVQSLGLIGAALAIGGALLVQIGGSIFVLYRAKGRRYSTGEATESSHQRFRHSTNPS